MSSKNQTTYRFEVDLDKSRAPRAYRGRQSLWEDDIGRIYQLVEQHVELLRTADEERDRRRQGDAEEMPHLSIAVFGPSGSGKSSLLRTLAHTVNRPSGPGRSRHGIWEGIRSLRPMDPTTWAPTDQFLYAFLAAALEEGRDAEEESRRGVSEGLSRVQLAFQDVNEYLRVVDDPGAPEGHDPLGLSLEKLERHTSGLRLKKAVGNFVEELAKEFKSQVVILPVDDLDMVPDHLVSSLLTYQSFLTHPRLVPVFTFTDRMPEELLVAHFENRLIHDDGRERIAAGAARLSITEQLAGHFLTRCFPVRNRIRLGPAPARVQRAILDHHAKGAGTPEQQGEQTVLELLITGSFLLFGHPDLKDAHRVRAAVRPSTLRRQFQVVDALTECHLHVFRVPQLAKLANNAIDPADLQKLAADELGVESWKDWPGRKNRLRMKWAADQKDLIEDANYQALAKQLKEELKINATWATIFNGAVWSLLNVHRDTLRELGLFLEDLYSWSPKELRSVVLGRILAQERTTRRTVVDRWFNRTDYRRSQVLSLLAANVFRPWMTGEEPYGDDQIAIREQLILDADDSKSLDNRWDENNQEEMRHQTLERLTFPATEGLLWFLNVTLGFYLPQVMARNWSEALSGDESLEGRISGNGWDLQQAPINAIRIADAKQEILTFGTLFLDPRGYRHALEAVTYNARRGKAEDRKKAVAWKGNSNWRSHLLLRIWSCGGHSRGRCWAAFSLWRGLSFIGQVLEVGLRNKLSLERLSKNALTASDRRRYKNHEKRNTAPLEKDDRKRYSAWHDVCTELRRTIRSHCSAGLVSGAFFDRDADDSRLLQGFPRWEPRQKGLEAEIENLARDLVDWLAFCWNDRIFPLPAGDVWIDWRDSFIRRLHGEYILGSLWPRLNSSYLEEQERYDCQRLAHLRSRSEEWLKKVKAPKTVKLPEKHEDKFRWSAAVAAGAWSDILLDYWRGCPPVLRMMLACPAFFKSRERFGPSPKGDQPDDVFEELQEGGDGTRFAKDKDKRLRFSRLTTLYLPPKVWKELGWGSDNKQPTPLVPDELCIERVGIEQFVSRPIERRSIAIERTEVRKIQDQDPKTYEVGPAPLERKPERPPSDGA